LFFDQIPQHQAVIGVCNMLFNLQTPPLILTMKMLKIWPKHQY
jgi:hypothetical protein